MVSPAYSNAAATWASEGTNSLSDMGSPSVGGQSAEYQTNRSDRWACGILWAVLVPHVELHALPKVEGVLTAAVRCPMTRRVQIIVTLRPKTRLVRTS